MYFDSHKMHSTAEESGTDSEMKSQEHFDEKNCIDLERYRNLVRTFIDLVNITPRVSLPLHCKFHLGLHFNRNTEFPSDIEDPKNDVDISIYSIFLKF